MRRVWRRLRRRRGREEIGRSQHVGAAKRPHFRFFAVLLRAQPERFVLSQSRTPILSPFVQRFVGPHVDRAAREFLASDERGVDFSAPPGEPALFAPDSISWRIFKNPVTLFIGGVTAVILEFAEPRVRSGVWDHSSFRRDPVGRLRRTGLAAMTTVYGARSTALKMIERVTAMHSQVQGETPSGEHYRALDVELLNWVQATATFGFLEAYSAYARPLSDADRDRSYSEARRSAALYGASGAPASLVEQRALFKQMAPRFERSDIVFEFLGTMKRAQALPQPVQIAQHSFVRAAVDLVPSDIRDVLGLNARYGLRPFEGFAVRRAARRAEKLVLPSSPAVQACRRLGLADDYLYRRG